MADAAAWRFACLTSLRPDESRVDEFVADHGRAPRELNCDFPTELLTVPEETTTARRHLHPARHAAPGDHIAPQRRGGVLAGRSESNGPTTDYRSEVEALRAA